MTKDELQKYLIKKRSNLGLTHQDVVDKSGAMITRQYYGMIENGDRRPSVDVAKKIASVLDIEWTIFFENNSNQELLDKTTA